MVKKDLELRKAKKKWLSIPLSFVGTKERGLDFTPERKLKGEKAWL